jgi:hypothetical protein
MRKCVYLFLLIAFILEAASKKSFAQAAPKDSSSQQYAFNSAVSHFNNSLGDESRLYNGPEYSFYDPTITGNAYFMDVKAFTQGAVFYDGALFTGVPMLYDLYDDKVVVLHYNNFSKFTLLTEKVASFDFLNHHFININADSISNNTAGLKSGYYDQLYNGKTKVLVKRSKSIQRISGGTSDYEKFFDPAKDFYIKKNKTYYSVSSQGSLLNVFKDRKKDLEQYMKSNQMKYRTDPEQTMVKVAAYYDHLSK